MVIALWIAVIVAGLIGATWNQRKAGEHRSHGQDEAFANRTALTALIVIGTVILPVFLILQALGLELVR